MTYGEALRLAGVLARDPGSQVAAAVAGWEYPMTREAAIGADQYDLAHAVAAGGRSRPKPYPRPWDKRRVTRSSRPLTLAEYRARYPRSDRPY